MRPERPEFLSDTLHIITLIAIPIHIFGTYCILFKTPKTMGSVKWIMFNFHFWCMCLDYGVTILTVPILLFPALGGWPYGILSDWNVPVEIQTYLILTLIPVVTAAVITIFENRYFLVFGKESKWSRCRIPLDVFNYLFAMSWSIPAFVMIPDQKMAVREALEMVGPSNIPDVIRNGPIFILSLELKTVTLPCFVIVFTMVCEAFWFVALMKRGMKRLSETARFSKNTLRMQKKFLNAVYIQVSMYMFSIQLPIGYFFFSILLKIYNQAANNFCIVLFSLNGGLATIVMIWVHTPYRDFAFKILRIEKWRKKIAKVKISDAAISVAPTTAQS